MFTISFSPALVSRCNFIGQSVHGIQAVVSKDGVEVFRSAASTKRISPKIEAQDWIKAQAA